MADFTEPSSEVHSENSGQTVGGDLRQRAGGDIVGRDKFDYTDQSQHNRTNAVVNVNVGGGPRSNRRNALFEQQSLEILRKGSAHRYESRIGQDLVSVSLSFEESLAALPPRLNSYQPLRKEAVDPVPLDKTIRDIYDACVANGAGRLLILGDPGAGKTTCLLALATELAAARPKPVPVYIPVSRWRQGAARRRSLIDRMMFWRKQHKLSSHPMTIWLSEQMHESHHIDIDGASRLIEEGLLLLFVDGLDEIKDAAGRESFVHYLNDFLKIYPLPIVLSCRRAEYEALTSQVEFDDAVIIQALRDDDVVHALQSGGQRLAGALTAIRQDPVLLDLCRVPFLLQILAYSYADVDAAQIASEGDRAARRAAMFDDYVDRQLGAKGPLVIPAASSVRALSSLAQRLDRRRFTEFRMQDMRLTWLVPSQSVVWALRFCTVAAILYLLVGLSAYRAVVFAVPMILAWQFSGYRSWRRQNVSPNDIIASIAIGVAGGLIVLIVNWRFFRSIDIGPFHALPSWANIIILGMIVGLCAGVVTSGIGQIETRASASAYSVLGRMVRNGIVGLVVCGTVTFVGAILTIDAAGTSKYIPAIVGDQRYDAGFSYSVTLALLAGSGFGLFLGLGAVIDHLVVRLVMLTVPSAPVRYVSWLENMVSRRLLYRAGDGYVFQHKLLRDYFAARSRPTPR